MAWAVDQFRAAGISDVRTQPIAQDPKAGVQDQTFRDLKATNGVAVIAGRSDETIVLNAHVDGWFDGAGDNADGLAVLVALARHFAKPENRPARTLVFVASAGHHTPGINGPRSVTSLLPEPRRPMATARRWPILVRRRSPSA